ncbi:MAG: hypothetical protein M3500_15210 [Actinomycetota bacterium]|nr:hypothetical protein [Actinomycetota bacterium]
MSELVWFRCYVEQLLQEMWGECQAAGRAERHNRTQPFRLGPGRRSGVSEYSLPASAVDADTLAGMLGMVSVRADDLGPMLTAVYEGHTPYAGDAIHESQSGEDAA